MTEVKAARGTTYRASNPPRRNGNGNEWANYGRVFIDDTGKHGTLYLEVTVAQLEQLIATSDMAGRIKARVALSRRDRVIKAGTEELDAIAS